MAATGHWRLWIMIRSFSSTYPNTSSPGIGWQHSAMMYFFCKLSSVSLSTCFGLIFSFSCGSFSSCFSLLLPKEKVRYFFQLLVCFSFSSFLSASPRMIALLPMAASNSSSFFALCSLRSFSITASSGRISSFFKNSLRISSPIFWFALRSLRRMAAILARARAVVAKTSHCGCTRCDFEVRISTWSPLCNLWLNGTNLWLTLAPIQWLPISVCRENAKSRAVEFCGIVFSSPLGVNTNISEANKLSLMVSRKSMASGCGSSNISLMVFNHFSNSPSSSLPPPSLYFQ